MKKILNIAFRQVKNGSAKGSIDCVFLDFFNKNNNRIECYCHVGQHSEGDYDYFLECTKKADFEKYSSLLNEIKSIYSDYEIVIHSRLKKAV